MINLPPSTVHNLMHIFGDIAFRVAEFAWSSAKRAREARRIAGATPAESHATRVTDSSPVDLLK